MKLPNGLKIKRMLKEHHCKYLEELLGQYGLLPVLDNGKLKWVCFNLGEKFK